MSMKLYFASGNAHKAREFQALVDAGELRGAVEIVSARAVGGMPRVEEDTGAFIGNARKKARALREKLRALSPDAGAWVLADDSGLCVDALGGAPGVESAYYAGPQGDSAANLAKLAREMRDVPDEKRGAYFVCVLFLIGPDGVEHVFEGRCPGRLVREPREGGGFGYDPLFAPEGFSRTFSELGDAEKNKLSHRALAWIEMARFLNTVKDR
ncbi:XTP/dITP diphosphohydrolase [Ereboglobus sp. PH5-10]|nr:XTP/dITP diphosphohydrolase [Ereboglobus sp. PH5-10]